MSRTSRSPRSSASSRSVVKRATGRTNAHVLACSEKTWSPRKFSGSEDCLVKFDSNTGRQPFHHQFRRQSPRTPRPRKRFPFREARAQLHALRLPGLYSTLIIALVCSERSAEIYNRAEGRLDPSPHRDPSSPPFDSKQDDGLASHFPALRHPERAESGSSFHSR